MKVNPSANERHPMSTPTRYRRVIAFVLIPEDYVNPLCPAADLQSVLDDSASPDWPLPLSVYRAAFADENIWAENGEVIEEIDSADGTQTIMAKVTGRITRANFIEPYLGPIELIGDWPID